HNGIGSLTKFIINPLIEEELNGDFSFSFEYPLFAPFGIQIEGGSIIKAGVPDGTNQLFRVYRPTKSMGYLRVQARHIFYDLADNLIEDTFIVDKSGQGAMDQMRRTTQYPHDFQFFSDIPIVASVRMVRYNPIEALL